MFIRKFFNISHSDLQFIEEYHTLIDGLEDYQGLKDLTLDQLDANLIINEIFTCINQKIFSTICAKVKNDDFILPSHSVIKTSAIKNKLLKSCNDRINEFSPYLNCLVSSFQNELDNVDVRNKNLDDVVSDVFDILVENTIE